MIPPPLESKNSIFTSSFLQKTFGFKENLLLLGLFGLPGISLVLTNLLTSRKQKSSSFFLIILAIGLMSAGLLGIVLNASSIVSYVLICVSIPLLAIAVDCYNRTPNSNAILHLINMGYVAMALNFLLMTRSPDLYILLWRRILPSVVPAFNMLILCLLFQNVGYFLLWEIFYPLKRILLRWSSSPINLVNLSFVDTPVKHFYLILTLISAGLISRIWNFSSGNIYYTDGSAIPGEISSFLGQFDGLYNVGILYGCGLSLDAAYRKIVKPINFIWILAILELLYQVASGSKGRFFFLVIVPIATVFLLVRRQVSWKIFSTLSALGVTSWLLVYPTLTIYRDIRSGTINVTATDPLGQLVEAFQIFSQFSQQKYIDTILIPLTKSGVPEQVLSLTSVIHFQISQASELLWQRMFLFWVPRFLWAEKPVALSTNLIGRLTKRLGQEDFDTSVLTTAPGELFLYYGFWGSVVMLVVGILLRFFNEATSPFKSFSLFRVSILVAFLPKLSNILAVSFEGVFTGFILQLGVLYGVLKLFKEFSKPSIRA
jgi:hypothetical protein